MKDVQHYLALPNKIQIKKVIFQSIHKKSQTFPDHQGASKLTLRDQDKFRIDVKRMFSYHKYHQNLLRQG
jgi:hypothetical protein